jgi:ribosomal protein S18 acetylase RimI-like enzyme
MADVKVRSAVSPDFSILSAIDHTVKTETVWQLDRFFDGGLESINFREIRLPRAIRVEYPYYPEGLLERSKVMSVVLLACMDEVPVGYIAITTNHSLLTSWIKEIAVHERWRRRGFASVLIRAAHDWSVERDVHRLSMEMSSKNFPAISLARKLGFEFCGYNEFYYPNSDIALFFTKSFRK